MSKPDGQKLLKIARITRWVCRAAKLEKASKEFNGLAQRSEQQATAFEHKVLSQLAWLFLRGNTSDSQVGVTPYRAGYTGCRVRDC